MIMKIRKYTRFACDFETTVYDGQDTTLVWSAAFAELFKNDVHVLGSIDDFFKYFFENTAGNIILYFHNLKFDGSFILHYFLSNNEFKQALNGDEFFKDSHMKNNTYKYTISNQGQWYSIILKQNNRMIEIRDSLKLLPFSLRLIGESFETEHKKLEMEYKGFRYPNCPITDEERHYIENDVLVLKEALEICMSEGHDKLTVGSSCLSEFKSHFPKKYYEDLFPDLTEIYIDKNIYGSSTADEYIRRSYRGGWCYLKEDMADKLLHNGYTLDVNSLYPSVMHSESGSAYPIGLPTFWNGDIPEEISEDNYFFVRIRTEFKLRENFLPTIQIKRNWFYKNNEYLKTSNIYDSENDRYVDGFIDEKGKWNPAVVEMTLSQTDWWLINKHYELYNTEILDGCYFDTKIGVFDRYINFYSKIKKTSKGAKRQLAKLYLNNLYGKMASSKNSSYKIVYLGEDNCIKYKTVVADNKKAGYIPVGAAITSYARAFTITAAQQNYASFVYADTDSIHCIGNVEDVKGVELHDVDFCKWKKEVEWDTAIFVRQKTYIEKSKDIVDVKCAGMPDRCKQLFIASMNGDLTVAKNEQEREFVEVKRDMSDFKVGLIVPSKLVQRQFVGGCLLTPEYYEMLPK